MTTLQELILEYLKRLQESVKMQSGIVALFVSLITVLLTIMSLFILLNI